MKKIKFLLLFAFVGQSNFFLSQAGAKWATGGNGISNGDFIGTTNNFPLDFRTNNSTKMTLGTNGVLQINNLSGNGNRFLQVDANGNITPFANGTATQVLYGNGTWGALPSSVNALSFSNNFLTTSPTTYVGLGMNNPQYPLDIAGTARIAQNVIIGNDATIGNNLTTTGVLNASGNFNVSGNTILSGGLKLASFSGNSGDLSLDNNGNVTLNPHIPVISCVPGSPQWSMSGDNFIPYATLQGLFNEASIGTCNNYDFILKSNALNRAWFKIDGTISFGANIASNTGGPEYKFHQGVIRLSGFNTYGGPQMVFDGGLHPYGDWGIEYAPSQFTKPGLNFWKPFGSPYSNNYILFLADDGTIGMGTDNPSSRLTLDSWGGDALKTITDNLNSKALSLNFKDVPNNLTKEFLSVRANGYTELKIYNPLSMPVIGQNPRVFTIKDMANNKDLFVVNADGKTYAREVEINLTATFPDYVFEKDYALKSISEVKTYIKENKHLPGFEKGEFYEKNGLNVNNIIVKQQEKMEEMMLYIIQLEEKLKTVDELSSRLKALEEKK